jgi:hypothetical protein
MPMPTDSPKRTGLAAATGCGLVSASACLVVFGMLSDDHVEGPYDGGDLTIGIFGAPLVAAAAAIVIAAFGHRLPARFAHLAVPFVLWLVALAGIGVAGGQRNNLETGVLWAVTAFLAHLLLGLRSRVLPILGLVVLVTVALTVTVAAQHRWRTQNFARVGVPAYLPEVPGYRLAGAYAGRSNLILNLQSDGGTGPRSLNVWINRSRESLARCPPGSDERWVQPVNGAPSSLGFCLPAGGLLSLSSGYPQQDIEDLLPTVRLRPVEMGILARYPDGGTEREAD